jgi:hypothetical protein
MHFHFQLLNCLQIYSELKMQGESHIKFLVIRPVFYEVECNKTFFKNVLTWEQGI